MLDMKQPQEMLAQLKQAAESRPPDPQLPAKLIMAKLETGASLGSYDRTPDWWAAAGNVGLVVAGLIEVGRWLDDL
jgi:hypothetical protein